MAFFEEPYSYIVYIGILAIIVVFLKIFFKNIFECCIWSIDKCYDKKIGNSYYTEDVPPDRSSER